MKHFTLTLAVLGLFLAAASPMLNAQDEDEFVYDAGGPERFFFPEANIGGFLFPELHFVYAGGVFDGSGSAEDFAFTEHDPLNDGGIQAIEVDIPLNINDVVTGLFAGVGFQGENHVWEAELEEAFIHYHVNDIISIGGGQFLNEFGFQNTQHLHSWFFVNNNLVNARALNEGHLITQGGEVLVRTPGNSGLVTFGFGGLRSHGEHGHGEEEEHGHEEEEEEHGHDEDEDEEHDEDHEEHLEADEAGFEGWVFSTDYKFRLPADPSIVLGTSFAIGENGFGRDTYAYGFGGQKVWNGHDHGNGGPDFCSGALMLRSEFIGREVKAVSEDGDLMNFDDYGISTALHYGISDVTTVSLRHDWVSDVEVAELTDIHRVSPAFTTHLGPGDRVKARFQYDYITGGAIDYEHAAFLQFSIQLGGTGGSHAGHNH